MRKKLRSRKMWAGILGTALGSLLYELGVPVEYTAVILAPLVAFIAGEAVADAAGARAAGAKVDGGGRGR